MNYIIFFCVFFITIFVYTHIRYHIKKINQLDIYDMGYIEKTALEEVCRLKQPVTFIINDNSIESDFSLKSMSTKFSTLSMKVYHLSDVPLSVSLNELNALLHKEDYTSYNNTSVTSDPIIKNALGNLDIYLAPPLTIRKSYDLWVGSQDASLKNKQHYYYRQYLYITNGYIECTIKTPDGQKQQSIIINQSEILFIPPYWTYDITFKNNAFVCVYRYDTYFSILSRLPKLCMEYIDSKHELHYSLKTIPLDNKLKDNISSTDTIDELPSKLGKNAGIKNTVNTKSSKRKRRKQRKKTD